MRALELRFVSLPIPFRVRFGHASAVREQAENIIVAVRDAQGRIGLGEGCPRSYVTGETVASATGFIEKHRADFQRARHQNTSMPHRARPMNS